MNEARHYEVTIDWSGELIRSVHTARSRAAARWDRYLDIADAWNDLTFREFLRLVRSIRVVKPRVGYDYIREHYGVEVAVGDRIALPDGRTGIIAAPRTSRECYVMVLLDGQRHPTPFHPIDLKARAA